MYVYVYVCMCVCVCVCVCICMYVYVRIHMHTHTSQVKEMPELLSVKVIPTEQCLLILTEQYTRTYIGEGNARAALCQGQQPPSDCSARTAPDISYASYLPICDDVCVSHHHIV